ncbi:claudin-15-like isoform X1 [Hypomesus transpacificus]|uniref:claudin-15-like isoform X1 n=1 Tax=Hypomesus transpacificus TaxID=137520 RepID=UPI001F072A63|nr:claudin-15-like isoform X1 [Hypomesus transpacificus]
MNQISEVLALSLCFVGWIMVAISLQDQYWKESSTDGSVITTSTIYENLWMSCASDSTGVYNCLDFPSMFSLPGFLAWVMVGVALPNRYWRVSSVDGNVITTSTIYENLWISCATDSTGVSNCRDFPSMLALSGYIQASRALMITSIVLGSLGIVAALVGMQCTKAGGEDYVMKGRIAGLGGMLFLLQGLCTMISVSWYAYNITQEFFDPFYPGTKYEIGEGLYIGWCSATLAICGGSCLMCSCKLGTPEQKLPYTYQPPTRGTVFSGPSVSQMPSQYGRNAYV